MVGQKIPKDPEGQVRTPVKTTGLPIHSEVKDPGMRHGRRGTAATPRLTSALRPRDPHLAKYNDNNDRGGPGNDERLSDDGLPEPTQVIDMGSLAARRTFGPRGRRHRPGKRL